MRLGEFGVEKGGVESWSCGAGSVHPPSPIRSAASGEAPRIGGASSVTLSLGAGREGPV